ncbi:DUF6273 domain-containing protein [Intestinimonas butyriciproducens]|uniref:DUF6273 domain-containing protein n=1 Tax=Intestinimonas butyriciproducens TaxID=1297617 RepID=UPI001AB04755|nr:DUF6273 domain-containing protein [Intestinimonas butyriciproducens]MBO3281137.1 fibronectin type III domain-containing protein [Intestinimonas butyriciproducens]
MASVALGTKSVGSIVKLKENGAAVNYIVVHQGKPSSSYDSSCDGTWLLRQDIAENRVWDSGNSNVLESSDIHSYLNNTWINRYDTDIRNAIKQVKIPYRQNGGSGGTDRSGSNGLSCKIFLLSGREVGFTNNESSYFPNDGAKLAYFESGNGSSAQQKRIAKLNGSATVWWLRSPRAGRTNLVWHVYSGGDYNGWVASSSCGVRPALILPSSLLVSDDGSITTNTAPTTPPSITIPSSISGGSTITVSWGASTDAEGNLEGYIVEKSIDGGSQWSQIYQGSALSTTNTVTFGTPTVMYRVKAYDSEGLESGYKTSNQVTVINNTAPSAPPSITVPLSVIGGENLTVTWAASSDSDGNLSGYILQRKVGAGEWSQVFKGNALTYQDTITKGWASVQYRVKAYDSYGAESAYTTSETRTVDNNTAPTITCDQASGSNLGTKSAGFSINYSVDDADGDAVSVVESMDGTTKRTFDATLEATNQFQVTGTYFQQLLNGQHTMKMKATDAGGKSVEHTLLFTKSVTALSITLAEAMEADAQITIAALSVSGDIPADANYQVLLTNNANDTEPVWEDATTEVKNGSNYLFENQSAQNGFAFNFKVIASRGSSGIGGYISSIQGGFQ